MVTPSPGPRRVVITSRPIRRGVAVIAPVCIAGAGPFPFLVDSGSSVSLVTPTLARRFALRRVGATEQAAGVACTAAVTPVRVGHWSLGAVRLSPQRVLEAALPRIGGRRVDGLIGSDVLSRFGAIRIDTASGRLALAGPERAPGATGPVVLPAAWTVDARLRARLQVQREAGAVIATTPVTFGRVTADLVVDTGAAMSAVSPALARAAHLAPTGGHAVLAAFGCAAHVGEVRSGRWQLGGREIPAQDLAQLPSHGLRVAGLLGSDVLLRRRAAVLDYAGHVLVLSGA